MHALFAYGRTMKRLLAENFKKKSLWNRVTYKALSGKLRNKELYRCLLSLLYSRELEQFHKLWKPVTHSTRVPTKIRRAPYHRGRHRDEVLPSFSFSSGPEGLWWPNTKSNFAFFPYCFNICTCIFFFGECCERSQIKTVTCTLLSISQ